MSIEEQTKKTTGAQSNEDAASILRSRQQAKALAEFGVTAFETNNLDDLLQNAAVRVSIGTHDSHCKVLELLQGNDRLLVRAAHGWEPNILGNVTFDTGRGSPAGYVLELYQQDPRINSVLCNNLTAQSDFAVPSVLNDHNIRAAINVIIRGKDEPFGVLEVDSIYADCFTRDDEHFLTEYANLMAAAIDRVKQSISQEATLKELSAAVHVRDVLMQNLQHDVKNALQQITSGMDIGLRRINDTLSSHMLSGQELSSLLLDRESALRAQLDAMRTAVEEMVLVDHHQEVNMANSLRKLCDSFMHYPMAESRPDITLDIETETAQVALSRAQHIGHIVAEFLRNSFKHAFPSSGGVIRIQLYSIGGKNRRFRLVLADNGRGIGSDHGTGHGMRLMQGFAQAAEAELHWKTPPEGTRLELVFTPGLEQQRGNEGHDGGQQGIDSSGGG